MELGHKCTLNPKPMTRDAEGLVHHGTNKLSLIAKPGTGVQWTWYAMELGHRCTLNPRPVTRDTVGLVHYGTDRQTFPIR